MKHWEYIQSLLDIIDRQNAVIRHQEEILAMYGVDEEDSVKEKQE